MSGEDHDQLEPSRSRMSAIQLALYHLQWTQWICWPNKKDAKYIKVSSISEGWPICLPHILHPSGSRHCSGTLRPWLRWPWWKSRGWNLHRTSLNLTSFKIINPKESEKMKRLVTNKSWRVGKIRESTWPPRMNPRINATKTSLIFFWRFGLLFVPHFHWKIPVEIAF